MLPTHSEEQITQHGGTPVSTRVLNQQDTSIFWKECLTCGIIKPPAQFRRDASYREGRREQCEACERSPVLSTEEHTFWLREKNNASWAVKNQRCAHQDDFRNDESRQGTRMHHSELLRRIRKLRSDLLFVDGRFVGDLSVYRLFGQPQSDGKDFKYLWYVPMGWLPECSLYRFDEARNIRVAEKERGWRTPLLRLIKAELLSEDDCEQAFGPALGERNNVWRRELYKFRNRKTT